MAGTIFKMSADTIIRVNGEYLSRHAGEKVRIVGEAIGRDGDRIRTTDGQMVTVHPSADAERITTRWVEVTGRVQNDNSVIEDMRIPIESEIDKDAWNKMITLMHRHSDIFF